MSGILVVEAGGKRFGVPVDEVREAARLGRVAPLPGGLATYAGLAIVRGQPLGVFDLGMALTGQRAEPNGLLVVLHDGPNALLVDRIEGIEPEPEGALTQSGACLLNLTKVFEMGI